MASTPCAPEKQTNRYVPDKRMFHIVYLVVAGALFGFAWFQWGWLSVWLAESNRLALVNGASLLGLIFAVISLGVTIYLAESVGSLQYRYKRKQRLPSIVADIAKYSGELRGHMKATPYPNDEIRATLARLGAACSAVKKYVPWRTHKTLAIVWMKSMAYTLTRRESFADEVFFELSWLNEELTHEVSDDVAEM